MRSTVIKLSCLISSQLNQPLLRCSAVDPRYVSLRKNTRSRGALIGSYGEYVHVWLGPVLEACLHCHLRIPLVTMAGAQWSVWRKHCDWFGGRDTTTLTSCTGNEAAQRRATGSAAVRLFWDTYLHLCDSFGTLTCTSVTLLDTFGMENMH